LKRRKNHFETTFVILYHNQMNRTKPEPTPSSPNFYVVLESVRFALNIGFNMRHVRRHDRSLMESDPEPGTLWFRIQDLPTRTLLPIPPLDEKKKKQKKTNSL
ncbi:hypothetical protein AVEN_203879-1, partial [Araneus ventricosus]